MEEKMDFTKHLNSIRILTALAFCFVAGASTLGAQVMCGDIITRPSKLTGNLTCVGDAGPGALIVMGPGGKLNLNGFTVDCNNDADATDTDGIRLTGMKALVHSGTVTDCRNGVVVIGSGKHHIASITSELNSLAGFFIGQNIDGNKLNANTAQQNGNDGFLVFVQADDSQFIGNVSDNNGTNGLRFQQSGGGHKVNGNTFSGNSGFVVGEHGFGPAPLLDSVDAAIPEAQRFRARMGPRRASVHGGAEGRAGDAPLLPKWLITMDLRQKNRFNECKECGCESASNHTGTDLVFSCRFG